MQDDKIYTVYIHTNTLNNKKYVGITSKDVSKRWVNGRGYRTGKFKNAINKYGWDKFSHEILATKLTEKEAKQLEIFYIKKFDTKNRNLGYNLTDGGDGTRGFQPCLGRKMSESEKESRRKALTGHYVSDVTKSKISEAAKGRTTWMKGKKHKQESIDKLKEKFKGTRFGSNNPKAKKVININTLEMYGSAKDLSVLLGVSYSHFKSKMNGKYKNNTPYMYLDDYEKQGRCSNG